MQEPNVVTDTKDMGSRDQHPSAVPGAKPRLLDQLREALRSRHYSRRTEQTYCL